MKNNTGQKHLQPKNINYVNRLNKICTEMNWKMYYKHISKHVFFQKKHFKILNMLYIFKYYIIEWKCCTLIWSQFTLCYKSFSGLM